MNISNRAAFDVADRSRETFNMFPRHWTQRAKANEAKWREQIEETKRQIQEDSAAINAI